MNWQKTLVIFLLCLSFLTCGIDELFYLPQVPEGGFNTQRNTYAIINIPANLINQIYYATGYVIYYKIYFNSNDITVEELRLKSTIYGGISTDYNYLDAFTNPVNTTSIITSTTFSNRGFYEIDLENIEINNVFSKSGGTFVFQFPIRAGDIPYIEYNGAEYNLLRSDNRGAFTPEPDKYFRNSDELKKPENLTPTKNADVLWQTNNSQSDNAYVSMYIVAVGTHPTNFSILYGRPTHISIFKLTPSN